MADSVFSKTMPDVPSNGMGNQPNYPSTRVPPGPYKSLKVLTFHTFKNKALKSPQKR